MFSHWQKYKRWSKTKTTQRMTSEKIRWKYKRVKGKTKRAIPKETRKKDTKKEIISKIRLKAEKYSPKGEMLIRFSSFKVV